MRHPQAGGSHHANARGPAGTEAEQAPAERVLRPAVRRAQSRRARALAVDMQVSRYRHRTLTILAFQIWLSKIRCTSVCTSLSIFSGCWSVLDFISRCSGCSGHKPALGACSGHGVRVRAAVGVARAPGRGRRGPRLGALQRDERLQLLWRPRLHADQAARRANMS